MSACVFVLICGCVSESEQQVVLLFNQLGYVDSSHIDLWAVNSYAPAEDPRQGQKEGSSHLKEKILLLGLEY